MANHNFQTCLCVDCLKAKEQQAQFVRETMGISPSAQTTELTNPGFFLVWVPGAPGAPRKRYTSESEALEAATSLVNNGCIEAFVLKTVQRVSSNKNIVVDKLS